MHYRPWRRRLHWYLLHTFERLLYRIDRGSLANEWYNRGFADGVTKAKKDYRTTVLLARDQIKNLQEALRVERTRWNANDPVLRAAVFQRAKQRCEYCGVRPHDNKLTLDHFVPVSKGGETSLDNLVAACRSCNKRKGSMDGHEFAELLKKPSPLRKNNPQPLL